MLETALKIAQKGKRAFLLISFLAYISCCAPHCLLQASDPANSCQVIEKTEINRILSDEESLPNYSIVILDRLPK